MPGLSDSRRAELATIARDAAVFYLAAAPAAAQRQRARVPALAVIFHWDCALIASHLEALQARYIYRLVRAHVAAPPLVDLVPRLRQVGASFVAHHAVALRDEVRATVRAACSSSGGGNPVSPLRVPDASRAQLLRAMQQAAHTAVRAGHLWRDAMPAATLQGLIERLIDGELAAWLEGDLISVAGDISEAEAAHMDTLVAALLGDARLAPFIPSARRARLVAMRVLLAPTVTLAGVRDAHRRGELSALDPDVRDHLIRAIWNDNAKRAECLAALKAEDERRARELREQNEFLHG